MPAQNTPYLNRVPRKTVLFFTLGIVPTTNELTAIAALMADKLNQVYVRNVAYAVPQGNGNYESCDAVASLTATIPTHYSALVTAGTVADLSAGANGGPTSGVIVDDAGATALSVSHSSGTMTLKLLATLPGGAPAIAPASAVAWSSATPGKATINASTGVATGVAAGTTVITATYTYTTGKTFVAKATLTVT